MQNPVVALRNQLGLSRQELAVLLCVGYQTVYQVEAGLVSHIQSSIKNPLRRLGFDVDELDTEYLAWRDSLRQNLGV
jgi:DNA-binding XRE family transcriptional regulator